MAPELLEKQLDLALPEVLDAINEAVFVLRSDGEILGANKSAIAMFGLEIDKLPGLNLATFLSEEDDEDLFAGDVMEYICGGLLKSRKVTFISKNGDPVASLTSSSLLGHDEGANARIVCTITDIRELEAIRQRAEEDRERMLLSAKHALIGMMASGIAHEIKNPLAIISGYAEFIKITAAGMGESGEKIASNADKIMAAAARTTTIINGIMSISRSDERDPFEEVFVQELIDETLSYSKKKVTDTQTNMIVDPIPNGLTLSCFPAQISQVLLNLISNGIDACSDIEDKWVRLTTKDLGNQVCFEVRDGGAGIPERLRQTIFEPFFSTKTRRKGTGLGLSLSKKLIKNHSGTLFLDDNQKNTCFIVVLPKTHDESELKIVSA